jgi:polyhydroxybutyrate depolymerase
VRSPPGPLCAAAARAALVAAPRTIARPAGPAPLVALALLSAGCGAVIPLAAPSPPGRGPSAGCAAATVPTGVSRGRTVVGGVERTYVLSVPAASTATAPTPLPLVFGFHGNRWTAEAFRSADGPEKASRGAAIFVYPDGLDSPIGGSGWDLDLDSRDLALFDQLLAELSAGACVDQDAIFAFGRSYGAYFVNTLACARAPYLRAVAATMGGGPFDDRCTGPISAWLSHAADDPLVSVDNGRESRDAYVARNGCAADAPEPASPSPCVAYRGCAAGTRVEWCEAPSGGHNPPPYFGPASWDFFVRSATTAR